MPAIRHLTDALIFDMDGVIVDSEPLHERAFIRLFEELGYADSHGIHFPDYYGKSDVRLLDDFLKQHGLSLSRQDLLDRRHGYLTAMLRQERPLFAGCLELLERCQSIWPLAVASGSRHAVINEVLALGNLRRRFQAVVSSEDVERGKPHPDIFLHAAARLGVESGRCLVIEDSDVGIAAANAAGMRSIGITNSLPRERLRQATLVVDTYSELTEALFEDG